MVTFLEGVELDESLRLPVSTRRPGLEGHLPSTKSNILLLQVTTEVHVEDRKSTHLNPTLPPPAPLPILDESLRLPVSTRRPGLEGHLPSTKSNILLLQVTTEVHV